LIRDWDVKVEGRNSTDFREIWRIVFKRHGDKEGYTLALREISKIIVRTEIERRKEWIRPV
jgi:hypothetical protein